MKPDCWSIPYGAWERSPGRTLAVPQLRLLKPLIDFRSSIRLSAQRWINIRIPRNLSSHRERKINVSISWVFLQAINTGLFTPHELELKVQSAVRSLTPGLLIRLSAELQFSLIHAKASNGRKASSVFKRSFNTFTQRFNEREARVISWLSSMTDLNSWINVMRCYREGKKEREM